MRANNFELSDRNGHKFYLKGTRKKWLINIPTALVTGDAYIATILFYFLFTFAMFFFEFLACNGIYIRLMGALKEVWLKRANRLGQVRNVFAKRTFPTLHEFCCIFQHPECWDVDVDDGGGQQYDMK